MDTASLLKASGYVTSTASVALLGAVAWEGASHDPVLLACLVAGMALSVLGMALRWLSHCRQKASRDEANPVRGQTVTPDASSPRARN